MQDFVEEWRQAEDRHGEDGVVCPWRQRGVPVKDGAQTGDDEIVDNIESKTTARHIGGKRSRAVEASLEPTHHSHAHQPAIEVVERAGYVLRQGVVCAEGGDDKRHARDNSESHQQNPVLAQDLLHFVAREDVVVHQEKNEIEHRLVEVPQAVESLGTQVADERLMGKLKDDTQQKNPDSTELGPVEPVRCVDFSDQQKQQREEPQILNEPQRSYAAEHPQEVFHRLRHRRQHIDTRQMGIKVAGHPVKHQKADGGRHQQFAGTALEPSASRVALQRIAGADTRQQEQQRHEPGIKDVLDDILILRSVAKAANTAENAFVIVEIDHVVEQYQQHRHPTQVVNPMFACHC